ncbi:alpha-glucan family phosphorylase [Tautonia sp. JC769]|uniref:alpha-glucan family phosphorylase n=1 Tax=Tautonia sp. JC769 TaxID=3232135 RepID=UPI00345A32B4
MVSQDTIINKLRELARNLWWTWQPHVVELFRELDPVLWRETDHNPVVFLDRIPPEQLVQRASEMALISRIDYAFRRLNEYLENRDSWGAIHASTLRARPVAYFSMEFGLHESLPIYSGGLGVLAGDHLKSASDLGIPLVAVGILYAEGYFRQSLDGEGWQHESYPYNDPARLPIEEALTPGGDPVRVAVESRSGTLHAKVWRVEVGRTTLLLLDSNVPENDEEDRSLTGRLYGGDARIRIRQELLLGVGGVRALFASGIDPSVIHLNEGHSAFAGLELTRTVMEAEGRPFGEAVRDVAGMTVFTTHTPVAAGHDRFGADLVEDALGPLREQLHLPPDDFLGLGRVHPGDHNEPFCMTVLALKLSRHANGVSALHGKVSRQMWHPLYPNRNEEEVPIGHITNGVHTLSWLAPQMKAIYDRHLGANWESRMRYPEVWDTASEIDDGEFWETHQVLKARLLEFVRQRLARQAQARGAAGDDLERYHRMFDLDTLTIGFARRFATYKRATLVMKDAERLAEIVNASDRPVQLIFAGKAHPEDRYGKEFIQQIVKISHSPQFRGRLAFIEDYDMNVARFLVQGVDVWLNNPRRPQEASGTSGQKVAMNGGLNCSILDGWWAEGYDGRNGFAIGSGRTHAVPSVQDDRDYLDLMSTLTHQVIPLYYDRGADGLPRRWIARVKDNLRTLGWRFNSDRQVMDYALHAYLPAGGGQPCAMPSF